MASTVQAQVLIEAKDTPTVQTTDYTSTNVVTVFDKHTVTNTTGSAITYSVNLVPNAGSAGPTNLIIDGRSILPGETYPCPEIVGQILNAGDFLSHIASATGLTVRSSGRIISTTS